MYIGNGMIVNAENPSAGIRVAPLYIDAVRRRGPPWLTPRPRAAHAVAGRPRWWVAGLSLFLALVVGLVVWLTQRDPTYHAPLSGPAAVAADLGRAAAALLHDLETAVRRDDAVAARRLGASPAATLARWRAWSATAAPCT